MIRNDTKIFDYDTIFFTTANISDISAKIKKLR